MTDLTEYGGPRVTVLISCFNYSQYVGQAIQSILAQDYPNIELIVIDDGSTDASWRVIRELADEHHFIAVRNQNQGLIASVREGVARATGKYFSSLNADDMKHPCAISALVSMMEQDELLGVVGGACQLIDAAGKVRRKLSVKAIQGTFDDVFLRRAHLCAPTLLFRTEAILGPQALDSRYPIDDLQMALFVTSSGWKVAVTSEILGNYRVHDANMSRNMLWEYQHVCRLYERYSYSSAYVAARRIVAQRYARAAALKNQGDMLGHALDDIRKFNGRLEFRTVIALIYGRIKNWYSI